MDNIDTDLIIVHIIAPDGTDHYPRFVYKSQAEKFVNMMRRNKIPSGILNPNYL